MEANTARVGRAQGALSSCRRLGRATWQRRTGYHRRSLVEAKTRDFKLLDERVMPLDFHQQVAELQIGFATLNRVTAPGTPHKPRAGQLSLGTAALQSSPDL